MDRDNRQKSSVDKVNDFINRGRSTYQDAKRLKTLYRGIRAVRTVAQASNPASLSVVAIIFVVLLLAFGFISLFGGGGGGAGDTSDVSGGGCQGILADSYDATPSNPVTLTAVNCENIPTPVTYAWTTSDTADTLSDPTGETTTYTPSSSTIKDVVITLTMCSTVSSGACSSDSITINASSLLTCTLDYTLYPAACLKEVFNIVVHNDSNISHLATIYKIFASTNSENYRRLLTNGGNVLNIYIQACSSSCISLGGINTITLTGFFTRNLPYSSQRGLLIHESGHVIGKRNPGVKSEFDNVSLSQQDGSGCYAYDSSSCRPSLTRQFIRSYALRYYCPAYSSSCVSIDAHSESFAEAISNYLFISKGGGIYCSVKINDYPAQCPNTYMWTKNNIYKP